MGNTVLAGTRMVWLYGEENVPERYRDLLGELTGKKLKTARGWAIKESIRVRRAKLVSGNMPKWALPTTQ